MVREVFFQVISSGVNGNIVTSRGVISRSILESATLRSRGLGSLINCHLLVHFFKVQVLQVDSSGMLDEVPLQKFKNLKNTN